MVDLDWGATIRKQRADSRARDRTCYRCGDSLDETHWVRVSTEHRGPHAGTFADVTRTVCSDCAAAIGLLDYAIE